MKVRNGWARKRTTGEMTCRKERPSRQWFSKSTAVGVLRRRWVAWMLCLGLLLTGCALNPSVPSEEPPPPAVPIPEIKEAVAQTWLLPGTAPVDADAVWAEINTILNEELNTTVTLTRVPWDAWWNRSKTLLAADAAPDALYVAAGANWDGLYGTGGLLALEERTLRQCAPTITGALDQWDAEWVRNSRQDGRLWLVPAIGERTVEDVPVLIRGDLRALYGMAEIATLEDLETYLTELARAGAKVVPWNADADGLARFLTLAWFQPLQLAPVTPDFPFLAYSITDPNPVLVNVMEDDGFLEALGRLRRLTQSGALPDSALYARTSGADMFQGGMSACLIGNAAQVGQVYASVMQRHPEWKPERCLLNPQAKRARQPVSASGMAITASAKAPERVLTTLDRMYQDQRLQDLSACGLEGTHYSLDASGSLVPGDSASRYPYAESILGWTNLSLLRPPAAGGLYVREVTTHWLEQPDLLVTPVLGAFRFDPAPVAQEMSALGAVLGNEGRQLLSGTDSAVPESLDRLREAFAQAGIEAVRVEMQRQADAWLADRKAGASAAP